MKNKFKKKAYRWRLFFFLNGHLVGAIVSVIGAWLYLSQYSGWSYALQAGLFFGSCAICSVLSLGGMVSYRDLKKHDEAVEQRVAQISLREQEENQEARGRNENSSDLIIPVATQLVGQMVVEPVTHLTPAGDSVCYLACEGYCSRTVRDSKTHQVIRNQSEEERKNFSAGFQRLVEKLKSSGELKSALDELSWHLVFLPASLLVFGPANFSLWFGTYRGYLYFDGVAALIVVAVGTWSGYCCALSSGTFFFDCGLKSFFQDAKTILSNLGKKRDGELKILPDSAIPEDSCPFCSEGRLMLLCIGSCTRAVVCSENPNHSRLAK